MRQGCTLMLQHRMMHKRLVLSATAFETGLGLGMCFLPMHGTSAADQAAGIAMERAGSRISCRQGDGPYKCGQGLPSPLSSLPLRHCNQRASAQRLVHAHQASLRAAALLATKLLSSWM